MPITAMAIRSQSRRRHVRRLSRLQSDEATGGRCHVRILLEARTGCYDTVKLPKSFNVKWLQSKFNLDHAVHEGLQAADHHQS